jgi:hypothetical protein
MQLLFDNDTLDNDPKYNFIRDDSGEIAKVTKLFTESLWTKYHPYADSNFRGEIRSHFDERFWEMYLTCTLMYAGITIKEKNDKAGPDVRVEYKGNTIWIEAIAPTSGDQSSNDRVPELVITNPPTTQEVPDKQIILRYSSAIAEKYCKYFKYLNDGIISDNDFYIIAIYGGQITCSGIERELPRIVRSVLPFGWGQIIFDKRSGQKISEGYQYRERISKTSGSPVRTDIFLDTHYRHINAILFSNYNVWDCTNQMNSMGDDFIFVHNPLAHPLPDNFLNFGQHWKTELLEDKIGLSMISY